MMDILWQLIPRDFLAQLLIGFVLPWLLVIPVMAAWCLLDLPVEWRGP